MLYSLLKRPITPIVYWQSTTKYLTSWTLRIQFMYIKITQLYKLTKTKTFLAFLNVEVRSFGRNCMALYHMQSITLLTLFCFCNKVIFVMFPLPKEIQRTSGCSPRRIQQKPESIRAKVLKAWLQRSRDQNEVLWGQTCRTRGFAKSFVYLHNYLIANHK